MSDSRAHNLEAGGAAGYTKALQTNSCRASMAHIRQPRPDYGLDLQVEALPTFSVAHSSLESGTGPGGAHNMGWGKSREKLGNESVKWGW